MLRFPFWKLDRLRIISAHESEAIQTLQQLSVNQIDDIWV